MAWTRRVGLLAALSLTCVFVSAVPAAAHATVVTASPSPGSGLPQAPGAVVMRFSEPLNRSLSRIEVLAPSGRDVGVGPTRPVVGDVRAMQRKLGLVRPGRYTVRWVSVSRLDGHTLRGSYGFGIGTTGGTSEAVRASPLASEGPLGVIGRFVALVGLTLWAGYGVLAGVARRAGVRPVFLDAVARWAPVAVLVGTAASVLSSAIVASGSATRVLDVLSSSRSGQLRAVLLATAAVGIGVSAWRPRAGVVLAPVALVAEAWSGHAAAASIPPATVASFAVHLAAVGVWVFAIVAAVSAEPRILDALRAFSPYAVGAAAAVAATGLVNAAFEVGALDDFLSRDYGRWVLAKGAAFVVMAVLGFEHFRRRGREGVSPAGVRGPLRGEAAAAAVALGVATVLVAFPNPPREAAAAERAASVDPGLAHLAGHEALSLAGASGPFVVGLTVLPPRPGPVEARVQVLGVEPGDGLRSAHVKGVSGDSHVDLDLSSCGFRCFAGRGQIPAAGTWRLEVTMASNRGPVAVAFAAPLPAPSGAAVLGRALHAMARLRSSRLHEDLRGAVGGSLVAADYQFEAPDRMTLDVNGSQQVVIGSRTYHRDSTAQPWAVEESPPPFSWPATYFAQFWGPGVAARLLGDDAVDGVPAQVVAFVRPDLPAWFRVWVGTADGVVHREEMRAEGHLMDHTYRDFNVPITITPPAGAATGGP